MLARTFLDLTRIGCLAAMLTGCSGLRHATDEKPLFTGHSINWTAKPVFDAQGAGQELDELVDPVANNSIFGMRPTVALHNSVSEPIKEKGFRHWLKYKLGSPPVYLSDLPLPDLDHAMVNRLNNRGYMHATVGHELVRHGRRASVIFTVTPGPPRLITDVRMGIGQADELDSALVGHLAQCPLNVGEPYDLARLTEERARVADRLRDEGWYRIRPDDLIWVADTTVGADRVALHLRVKPATSSAKTRAYTIGQVTILSDQDDVLPPKDTLEVEGMHYVRYLQMYRPEAVMSGVFVRPGDTYSLALTNATQRYLSSYGVFRNVLVAYSDEPEQEGVLNAELALLPQKRFSLFSEMNLVSKSNNFSGPGVRLGFRDRNFLRGAEQFTLDLNGRFETQLSGAGQGTNAYEVGIKAGLAVPRMLLLPEPGGLRSRAPVTNIAAGFGFYRRIQLYGLRSATAGLGYNWRREKRIWHDLQLLEVSFNDLFNASDDFQAFLDDNPTIQRSFEDQFIIGVGYTYTRSTQSRDSQRNWIVYSLGIDEAGNLIDAIATRGGADRPPEGKELLGQRYAQYVRLRPELRWYHSIGPHGNQLVTRLLTHAAIGYGNNEVIPYVKQFYAGGTNSLRGFRARSVGPGSYATQLDNNLLVDQVGDLKLEVNAEYRFTISGFIKGALFADAGNVWLLREDPSRPGGEFKADTFVSEIALDAGFGLRIDPQVIVIRLDLAAPLRRPDLPAGERWVFDDLERQWNRNFILNIAIGYPF